MAKFLTETEMAADAAASKEFRNSVLKGIGNAAWNGTKAIGSNAAHAAYWGTATVGEAMFGAAKLGARAATSDVAANMGYTAYRGAKTVGKAILGGLAEEAPGKMTMTKEGKYLYKPSSFKLSGKGKALLFGSALLGGFIEASQENDMRYMGNIDSSSVRTATPDYNPKDYQRTSVDTAGADGSLVFALYRNRRG